MKGLFLGLLLIFILEKNLYLQILQGSQGQTKYGLPLTKNRIFRDLKNCIKDWEEENAVWEL